MALFEDHTDRTLLIKLSFHREQPDSPAHYIIAGAVFEGRKPLHKSQQMSFAIPDKAVDFAKLMAESFYASRGTIVAGVSPNPLEMDDGDIPF